MSRQYVERKEHLQYNETLLRPGSAGVAVWLGMLESEERGRVKTVGGGNELAEENERKE